MLRSRDSLVEVYRTDGKLCLYLQGCFVFACDGTTTAMPHSSERVVALLALRGGAATRHDVAATLWSKATGDRSAAALRTALWRLDSSPARGLVRARGRELALRDDLQVDFRATARRARDVIAGRPGEVGAGDIALLRDSRDLLPDWYEDWAIVEREQFPRAAPGSAGADLPEPEQGRPLRRCGSGRAGRRGRRTTP